MQNLQNFEDRNCIESEIKEQSGELNVEDDKELS